MDIERLIDRLEELFNDSPALPLTNNVVVNEDRMLELIDQMRVHIPEEVKKAQQVLNQRDRILAQAQEQANRIITKAREEAEQLVEKDTVLEMARKRAEQIIAEAEAEAESIRSETDRYVIERFAHLERELEHMLKQARDSILYLQQAAPTDEADEEH